MIDVFGYQVDTTTAALGIGALFVVWAVGLLLLFRVRNRPETALSYRERLRRALGRVTLRILGRPETTARRLLYLGLFFGVTVIAMSAFLIASANISASAESGPILRSIARLLTDFRLYAVVAILAMLAVRAAFWDILAGVTSRLTPYSKRAVKRYHSEVLSTDGTVRLIGTGDHSEDQLVAKLRRATNPESDIEDEMPATQRDESDDEPAAEIEDATAGALPGGDADGSDATGAMDQASSTALRDDDRGVDSAETEATADPTDRLRQTLQTFLLDFATAANADDLVWRFLVPSATVAALTFVVLQRLWFHPLVYVAIGAGSLVAGGVYYSGVKWRRRRRLASAREPPQAGGSGQTACLVKHIEIHGDSAPDAYVAWMGGRVYFSMDRTRFCNKVADRWWHRIHNRDVPPAIEERFAHNARMMLPTTYQTEFADSVEGRAAIQDELVDVVREAENPDGMVPKHALSEMVVNAGGRFGHDPDLVAEEYAHLHGAALAELDVTLENAAGEQSELTVVHLRTGGVLHDLAEIRATFAAEFDPDAESRYPLPQVGDLSPQWDIEMGDLRPLEGAAPDADATEGRTVAPIGGS